MCQIVRYKKNTPPTQVVNVYGHVWNLGWTYGKMCSGLAVWCMIKNNPPFWGTAVDHYNSSKYSNKSNSRSQCHSLLWRHVCFQLTTFNWPPKMADINKYLLWRHLQSPILLHVCSTIFYKVTIQKFFLSTRNSTGCRNSILSTTVVLTKLVLEI